MTACDRCGGASPTFLYFQRAAQRGGYAAWCAGCFLRFMAYTVVLSFVCGALVAWAVKS